MANASVPHLPVNHLFVDLENVKQIDPAVFQSRNLTIHLFLGPQNKKFDVAVVECLMAHAPVIKIIRTDKSGKNALDFVLAYHLGQAVLAEPKGYYHIISKDTGYDVLIDLLKSRQVKARRHPDWENLLVCLATKPPAPATTVQVSPLSEQAVKCLENLTKNPRNRPKKIKTLLTYAGNFLGKEKSTQLAESLVQELQRHGHITIDGDGNVSYPP